MAEERAVSEYRDAMKAIAAASTVLRMHDYSKILRDIDLADSIGAVIDPTLYRNKARAMREDRRVFAAAQTFLSTLEGLGLFDKEG